MAANTADNFTTGAISMRRIARDFGLLVGWAAATGMAVGFASAGVVALVAALGA